MGPTLHLTCVLFFRMGTLFACRGFLAAACPEMLPFSTTVRVSEGESGRVTVRCEWSVGGNGFRAKLRVRECGPTANATLVGAR